jgi:hypothetical protein
VNWVPRSLMRTLSIHEDEGVGESREQCPADLRLLRDVDEAFCQSGPLASA